MINFEYRYAAHWFKIPGFLFLDVPTPVKNEIKEFLLNFNEKELENYDYDLKGHLDKEYLIDPGPNLRYLVEDLSENYNKEFYEGVNQNSFHLTRDMRDRGLKYVLDTAWINFAKKYDFNPLHKHVGCYSFVIWVKIPYTMEREYQRYNPNGNETAHFTFCHPSTGGGLTFYQMPVDKEWEWKMAFFPSDLHHQVNPFYTSDQYRISISGNIRLGFANESD